MPLLFSTVECFERNNRTTGGDGVTVVWAKLDLSKKVGSA
jgi:hypothetical protein